MRPFLRLLAVLALIPAALPAWGQNRAGEFDHYILALTWMPAFCALDDRGATDPRCTPGRRTGWMLHGLWPQHPGGAWPEYCPTAQRSPSRTETAAQSDLFGSGGSAWHQWNKHGRCTGLSAADYYALSRRALDALRLPALFEGVDRTLRVAPQVIEDAFLAENPGLTEDMLVTTCRRDTLVELRLCLSRDLSPRPCDAEVRSCRLRTADLLPLR